MKNSITLTFIFFAILTLNAQSIIQSASVSPGAINLGNTTLIQVNLEQIGMCDTQVPTIDVDEFSKQINFNINYNFVPNCSASTQVISTSLNAKPLLEGIYTVNINLTVIGDATKNEMRSIGSLTVLDPNFPPCSSTPFENCPQLSNPVCGEDGQTYINECIAFFENGSATYQFGSCDDIITIDPLICNQLYNISANELLTEYECLGNECLSSNEFIFSYRHDSTGLFELNYDKSSTTEIMLATIENNSIECLEIGDINTLMINDLAQGDYLIIADGTSSTSVIFCPVSSLNENEEIFVSISPNPTSEQLKIEANQFQNFDYTITNIAGQILQKGKTSTSQTLDISILSKGNYFLNLKSSRHQLVRKFLVQ